MNNAIVGISGPAQSGKDSAADVLVQEFGFVKVSFADGVRDLMVRLDPVLSIHTGETVRLSALLEEGWSWQGLKALTDARDHMVAIGAGCREVLGSHVWVSTAFEKMERGKNYVIPDVRYANEALAIRQRGGQVWEIARPGVSPANVEESRSLAEFTGERAILNGGTLEDLRSYVTTIALMSLPPVSPWSEQLTLEMR